MPLRASSPRLAQAGANKRVQIGAEGTGAGKVLVGAALGLAGCFLGVGPKGDVSTPARTGRIPPSFRMQRLPKFLPPSDRRRPLGRRKLGPLQVLVDLQQFGCLPSTRHLDWLSADTPKNRDRAIQHEKQGQIENRPLALAR